MTNPYAFTDLFKNAFSFNKDTWDFNQIFATQRRNIEALSAANQAIVEGVQAVTRRQAEVARENVEQALRVSRDLFTGGSPEASLSKQADLTKQIFESALNNVREVTEMVTKSSFEAFDVLNKRASESLEEISQASGKTAPKRKAA